MVVEVSLFLTELILKILVHLVRENSMREEENEKPTHLSWFVFLWLFKRASVFGNLNGGIETE